MILHLYETESARNVINKTLAGKETFDVTLRRDFNMVSPEFKLKLPDAMKALGFNYCHFPEFNRYYFIDSVTNVSADIWHFECSCDVLETYRTEILNSNARFLRGIKNGDQLTTAMESNADANVENFLSTKGFSGEGSLILSTVGNNVQGA